MLPDGRRLHLQHGPIDLIIEAFGDTTECSAAYAQARTAFEGLLEGLAAELPELRRGLGARPPVFRDPVARRMAAVAWTHRATFVTPMAAVAGAVADQILAALCRGRCLARAYVNNGGDIAVHLAPGERFAVGLVTRPEFARLAGRFTIEAALPVRGVATSGWRGRSLSLGIADAVTVLARDAAAADVAATLIANAVNVEHPAIGRCPACEIDPDSDLGARPVTVAVGTLEPAAIAAALERGVAVTQSMRRAGLIHAAALSLADTTRVVDDGGAARRRMGSAPSPPRGEGWDEGRDAPRLIEPSPRPSSGFGRGSGRDPLHAAW